MPDVADQIICDPVAFMPDRTELDLSGIGLSVVEANWGESTVEAAMVRQHLGEAVVDTHLPNKDSILKLIVRGEEETPLPTVAGQLQAKVGRWHEAGGWIQRNFKVGGSFGSLACQVKKATLADFAGWQKGSSPDVTLALVTGPLWYATVEAESEVFTETSKRELIFELAEIAGTHPGLIRIRVTNTGEADWRGLILATESRDHPGAETKDTTAALAYDASALTLKGGSTDIGSGVIEHASLTAGWLTILNSEIAGVGHMTHRGVRRLFIRAEDLGTNAGDVQLRLRWRALGSLRWTENDIVPSPLVDAFQLLDMGECRPEQPALGDERWEWGLQARAPGGSGKVKVGRVLPLPTEQFVLLSSPAALQAADFQSQKSPGTVESKEAVEKSSWTGASNAKASDDSRATTILNTKVGGDRERESEYLWAAGFGFAVPEGATATNIVVEAEVSKSGDGEVYGEAALIVGGVVVTTALLGGAGLWTSKDTYLSTEFEETVVSGLTPSDLNAEDFGAGIVAIGTPDDEKEPTARVDHIRITIYYTEAADENRVCFAGRSLELRSDGIDRQHPEDDVWGQLIPEGFLPYASPSGLEERPTRFIVIPTQGDFDTLADSGTNKLSAQVFTQGAYAFSREAT